MSTTSIEPTLPRLDRERLSHAYILISPDGQKRRLARELAAFMLCREKKSEPCMVCPACRRIMAGIYPDVISVERPLDDKGNKKKEISVSQIRALTADAVILPSESDFKLYIIEDAEAMNPQAQNALLKNLEEPPKWVRFILCVENPGALLDTIRSRCIELAARSDAETAFGDEEREVLRLIEKGDARSLLKRCISLEERSPAELDEFFKRLQLLTAETLCRGSSTLSCGRLTKLHELTVRCRDQLRVNVSTKHVLGLLSVRAINLE